MSDINSGESDTSDGLSPGKTCKVLTIGHSTRPIETFLESLAAHQVTQLLDVRTVSRSRHNPQFNTDALPGSLAETRIGYARVPGLGGFRRPARWCNLSFRGYADYMRARNLPTTSAGSSNWHVQSMSRRGSCWDNAPMESFYKTLKVEHVYLVDYRTRDEARMDIVLWIEGFYNGSRLHSSVGYRSPVSAESGLKAV